MFPRERTTPAKPRTTKLSRRRACDARGRRALISIRASCGSTSPGGVDPDLVRRAERALRRIIRDEGMSAIMVEQKRAEGARRHLPWAAIPRARHGVYEGG